MVYFPSSPNLNFIGRDWSFYPSHNRNGALNIVAGEWAIASRILHVLLTQKGEDPLHPSLGIAPDLFEPLSNYDPRYFVFHAEEELIKWNRLARIGFESIKVGVIVYENYKNGIAIEVRFVPVEDSYSHVLTFGFWEYVGAIHDRSYNTFLNGITLNGSRFIGLA